MRLNRCGWLLGVVCGLAPAGFASAQQGEAEAPPDASPAAGVSDIADVSLDELLGTQTVSAAKVERTSHEAPALVTAVPRELRRRFDWTTINDVLFHQPGFFISQDYERITVGSRGLFESWNNNHLLLLVDGLPFNDNETGGAYTWEITPLFFVDTMEVIRGPGSALYGSNATNGVVALRTASPKSGDILGRAQLRFGEEGTLRYEALAGGTRGGFALVAGYSGYGTDGNRYLSYDGSGRVDAAGELMKFRTRDRRQSGYAFAKLEGQEVAKGLTLEVHNQRWEYETGHGWFFWVPDVGDLQREMRTLVSLSYETEHEALRPHFAVRYQRHDLHHDLRWLPNDAYEGYYPSGVDEYIDTRFEDVFARAQLGYDMGDGMSLLGAVEYDLFSYRGDDYHSANADLADFDGGYPPRAGPTDLGPYYEYAKGHPVHTLAVLGQFVSGRLAELVEVTAGLRYDRQFFTFTDIADAARPERDKVFQQLSPRLGVVVTPTPELALKALAARAFRAPAPLEMFGANTWAVSSNIGALEPELVTTLELGADYKLSRHLNWRANVFDLRFENQIAYSPDLTLVNYYSRHNVGAETELLFEAPVAGGELSGFGNYAYVVMLDEEIGVEGVAPSKHLTWAPEHVAKAGASYGYGPFSGFLQGIYQGTVRRRATDKLSVDNSLLRPRRVPDFLLLDLGVSYAPEAWGRVTLKTTNLLDSRAAIVKGGDLPFDYRLEGRRFWAVVEADL